MTRQQQCIEEIRAQYRNMQEMPRNSLNGSLETLAHDLNAADFHFVFELIQNAEDNEYETSRSPKLRFEMREMELGSIQTLALVVYNNEQGFQEKHVKAVCQVGQTTKNKAEGYIGEKGIGFKSVFRVTDCPHVFSNGFHFALPKHDEETGLGYIVPRWTDPVPDYVTADVTTIVLPLHSQVPKHVQSVAKKLRDIAPETILFLKKLEAIEIAYRKHEIRIAKETNSSPVVELTRTVQRHTATQRTTAKYWMQSRTFDVPQKAQNEKREGLIDREVSVAIPLCPTEHGDKLFAYLPVWENTGLPFLVNADFLLTSSREDVRVGLPWNEWLRDCIADVYVGAFCACLASAEPQRYSAYKSIPLGGDRPFLEPVLRTIRERLKQAPCVAVLPDGEILKPSRTILGVPDELRALLVCGDALPLHLCDAVRLVLPEIEPYAKQLRWLGAQQWNDTDTGNCLSDATWLSGRSLAWFIDLYRVLIKRQFAQDLTKSHIIPVQVRPLVLSSPGAQNTYFAGDEGATLAMSQIPDWQRQFSPVVFVAGEFMALVDAERDTDLREWMCSKLHVYEFTLNNHCVDLSEALATRYTELSSSQIIEATRFILQHLDGSQIKWEKMPVVLADGTIMPLEHARQNGIAVVVPAGDNPAAGWQHIWTTQDDRLHFTVLSDEYCTTPWNEDERKKVFQHFAVTPYPGFRRYGNGMEVLTCAEDNLLSRCKGMAAVSQRWNTKLVGFASPIKMGTLGEMESAALEAWLLQAISPLRSRYSVALDLGDSQLHKIGLKSECVYRKRGNSCGYTDSSVLESLKRQRWLRSTRGLVRPREAFRASEATTQVFGDLVPYYTGELPKELLDVIGVWDGITRQALISLLEQEKTAQLPDPKLLSILYAQCGVRSLGDDLSEHALVFVPQTIENGDQSQSPHGVWKGPADLSESEIGAFRSCFGGILDPLFRRLSGAEERDSQRKRAVQAAVATGASLQAAESFLSLSPAEQDRIMEQQCRPPFPSQPVADHARRKTLKSEQHEDQPDKAYEVRAHSVRLKRQTRAMKVYLRQKYTNNGGEVLCCQLCRRSLDVASFNKRDGNPYFEAVEFIRASAKEDQANCLLLCPVCAAKFQELVKSQYKKQDSQEPAFMKTLLEQAHEAKWVIKVAMNGREESLQFVEAHWIDLQVIASKVTAPDLV